MQTLDQTLDQLGPIERWRRAGRVFGEAPRPAVAHAAGERVADRAAGKPVRRDDAEGVLPGVEAGHLRDQRPGHTHADPAQHLAGHVVRQRKVLGAERVDGRRDDELLLRGQAREAAERRRRGMSVEPADDLPLDAVDPIDQQCNKEEEQ